MSPTIKGLSSFHLKYILQERKFSCWPGGSPRPFTLHFTKFASTPPLPVPPFPLLPLEFADSLTIWEQHNRQQNSLKGQCHKNFDLKGQSNEIFDLQFFFHNSNLPVPMTNRLKYFWFWFIIHWFIRILSPKIWLPGVSYPVQSISPGYHTPASQSRGTVPLSSLL